jgi:HEAT repeat protein
MWALGELGAAAATPEVLHALLQALSDPDQDVREIVAWALGELGATATPEILPALLQALTSVVQYEVIIRQAAAWALGELGVAAATPEVLRALFQALTDPTEDVRCAVAWALGELGAAAATSEILHILLRIITGRGKGFIRHAAAEAIDKLSGYVHPQDRAAVVQYLVPLARSRDMEQRDVGYTGLRNVLAAASA